MCAFLFLVALAVLILTACIALRSLRKVPRADGVPRRHVRGEVGSPWPRARQVQLLECIVHVADPRAAEIAEAAHVRRVAARAATLAVRRFGATAAIRRGGAHHCDAERGRPLVPEHGPLSAAAAAAAARGGA